MGTRGVSETPAYASQEFQLRLKDAVSLTDLQPTLESATFIVVTALDLKSG